ncbi:hypothetical protein [Acinetobacter sp. 251-1]|uniref:hypothetical protein n=1 Tax=Acinetobacter sp. 251-1 TaxID=2746720 RepID=UPI002576B635|nr:hypothetical protein [Acinetobacter sp. 251-1]MDM1762104.1 hypothetical protein [Acinetobacter sp. 251-1]
MKIFTTLELAENPSNIQTLTFSMNDDFESQIEELESSDTSLMAEDCAENNSVLKTAVKYWLGYGLYYPNIEAIDQDLLQAKFPKIILLHQNDPNIEFFTQFGHVVFDFEQYQQSVMELVYFATDINYD